MILTHPNIHFNNKIGATVKKTLISFVIALPLLSCHINKSYGVPSREDGISSVLKRTKGMKQEPGCQLKGRDAEFKVPDGRAIIYSGALKKDERTREMVCLENRAFILTDRSLVIVTAAGLDESDGNIRLNSFLSRTDMTDILKKGLVAWTQTGEACYFLTRDRKLTVLPNEEGDVSEFSVPFDTSGVRMDRMTYQSGFLFIAPDKRSVYAFKLTEQKGAKMMPVITKTEEPGFFIEKRVLFFGKKGENEKKIEITGPDLGDVWIR